MVARSLRAGVLERWIYWTKEQRDREASSVTPVANPVVWMWISVRRHPSHKGGECTTRPPLVAGCGITPSLEDIAPFSQDKLGRFAPAEAGKVNVAPSYITPGAREKRILPGFSLTVRTG
jgi:hypothetical protein